ncbi:hypothetical protein ACJX0J_015027, partial [Zea mays]
GAILSAFHTPKLLRAAATLYLQKQLPVNTPYFAFIPLIRNKDAGTQRYTSRHLAVQDNHVKPKKIRILEMLKNNCQCTGFVNLPSQKSFSIAFFISRNLGNMFCTVAAEVSLLGTCLLSFKHFDIEKSMELFTTQHDIAIFLIYDFLYLQSFVRDSLTDRVVIEQCGIVVFLICNIGFGLKEHEEVSFSWTKHEQRLYLIENLYLYLFLLMPRSAHYFLKKHLTHHRYQCDVLWLVGLRKIFPKMHYRMFTLVPFHFIKEEDEIYGDIHPEFHLLNGPHMYPNKKGPLIEFEDQNLLMHSFPNLCSADILSIYSLNSHVNQICLLHIGHI